MTGLEPTIGSVSSAFAATQARGSADVPVDLGLVEIDDAQYTIAHELAHGGMGRIRVARDRRLGRMVAIKEVLVRDGELARRFEREAQITARLQHPSIVSVYEAGRWASGMPFYAMPLIEGRSLDAVIADCKTLDRRLGLVPNVLAVADAIAYAHGRRIIHRDLKPRNVLVGSFGETVVIDWGLAKDLASSERDDVVGATTHGEALETELGEVMGTPSYMPPEQAAGAAVDERADVYAIGALLAHALTGRPPYEGPTSAAVLAAVRTGPPVAVSRREPGAPADLIAIVERAMARDPAARYATARELAEDLRRFQTGQLVGAHRYTRWQLARRWLRRHRALVIAACAIAIIGSLAIQRVVNARVVASAQRDAAEARRADAEDLVAFLVTEMRDKLEPMGRLDILDEFARKAIAYYDHHGGDLLYAEAGNRADEFIDLGEFLSAAGHPSEALAQDIAALETFQAMAAQTPASPELLHRIADTQQRIGDLLQAEARLDDAERAYATSRIVIAQLAAGDPNDLATQQDFAFAHLRAGDMAVKRNKSIVAETEYRAMLAIGDALVAKDRGTAPLRIQCKANAALAKLLAARGDRATVAAGTAEVAAAQKLVEREPDNALWLDFLASAHADLGDALSSTGDAAGSVVEVRAARDGYRALIARDASNDDWQSNKAYADARLADAARERGDLQEARAGFEAGIATASAAATHDRSNLRWRQTLATEHHGLARVRLALGDASGAMTELDAELAIVEQLAAQAPTDRGVERDRASCEHVRGEALLAVGRTSDAHEQFRAELARWRQLAAEDPHNATLEQGAASAQAALER